MSLVADEIPHHNHLKADPEAVPVENSVETQVLPEEVAPVENSVETHRNHLKEDLGAVPVENTVETQVLPEEVAGDPKEKLEVKVEAPTENRVEKVVLREQTCTFLIRKVAAHPAFVDKYRPVYGV